jgi:hypothetical protein
VNGWLLGGIALAIVVLGVFLHQRGVIDLSDKSRRPGSYSGVLGVADELFSPSKYEAQLEMDRQTVVPAPAPVAGDGDHGVYSGRVTITF